MEIAEQGKLYKPVANFLAGLFKSSVSWFVPGNIIDAIFTSQNFHPITSLANLPGHKVWMNYCERQLPDLKNVLYILIQAKYICQVKI